MENVLDNFKESWANLFGESNTSIYLFPYLQILLEEIIFWLIYNYLGYLFHLNGKALSHLVYNKLFHSKINIGNNILFILYPLLI